MDRKKRIDLSQTDPMMKVTALKADAIRNLVSKMFGGGGVIKVENSLPTEFHSRQIADAIHQRKPFKINHSDGIFSTVIEKDGKTIQGPILCAEYQSSPNSGQLLRSNFYQVGMTENHPDLVRGRKIRHVLIMTGTGHPSIYTSSHGNVLESRVLMGVIDLNKIHDDDFNMENPYDVVLRLSKNVVTDRESYIRASDYVLSATHDAVERDRLLASIAIAAATKPNGAYLMDELREHNMGKQADEVLKKFTEKHFGAELVEKGKTEGRIEGRIEDIKRLLSFSGRTIDAESVGACMSAEELEHLFDLTAKSLLSGDWNEVDNLLSSQSSPKL